MTTTPNPQPIPAPSLREAPQWLLLFWKDAEPLEWTVYTSPTEAADAFDKVAPSWSGALLCRVVQDSATVSQCDRLALAADDAREKEYKMMWLGIAEAFGVQPGHFPTMGEVIDHGKAQSAEIAALRERVETLKTDCAGAEADAQRFSDESVHLRARVAELEATLSVQTDQGKKEEDYMRGGRLHKTYPPCAVCGKPATCFGAYEEAPEEEFACDECCGHGCEDGHCISIADYIGRLRGEQEAIADNQSSTITAQEQTIRDLVEALERTRSICGGLLSPSKEEEQVWRISNSALSRAQSGQAKP